MLLGLLLGVALAYPGSGGAQPFPLFSSLTREDRPAFILELSGSASQGFWDSEAELRHADTTLEELKAVAGMYLPLGSRFYLLFLLPYGTRLLDRSEPLSYDFARQGFMDPYGEAGWVLFREPDLKVYGGWRPSLGTPHLFLSPTEPVGSVPLGTGAHRLYGGARLLFPFLSQKGEVSAYYAHARVAEGFFFVEPIFPLLRSSPLKRVGYFLHLPFPLLRESGFYLTLSGFHEAARNRVNAHWATLGIHWGLGEESFELELTIPFYGRDFPLPPPWNYLEPEPFMGTTLLFRWLTSRW